MEMDGRGGRGGRRGSGPRRQVRAQAAPRGFIAVKTEGEVGEADKMDARFSDGGEEARAVILRQTLGTKPRRPSPLGQGRDPAGHADE